MATERAVAIGAKPRRVASTAQALTGLMDQGGSPGRGLLIFSAGELRRRRSMKLYGGRLVVVARARRLRQALSPATMRRLPASAPHERISDRPEAIQGALQALRLGPG